MEDSYTAVYVPEYTGHPSASIMKSRIRLLRRCMVRLSRPQKSILFMIIMVLIIFVVILTSFSWMPDQNQNKSLPDYFLEQSKFRQQKNIIQSSSIQTDDGNNNHVFQQEEPHILAPHDDPVIGKGLPAGRHARDGLPLAKDNPVVGDNEEPIDNFIDSKKEDDTDQFDDKVEVKVTPSSSTATHTSTTVKAALDLKSRIDEQVKENIRSVISLDPVVPLKKKSKAKTGLSFTPVITKTMMKNLKFSGPENPRQKAVVEAFTHAWGGYRNYSMGRDHLQSVSARGQDWFGLGLTLVDSLDTMLIMGLSKEFFEARDWVDDHLTFDSSKNVNLFETTIRVLGGLLSAFHLSGDKMFLDKANELGSILFVGFKSPSGIPYSDVNLKNKLAHGPQWNPDSTTSEVSSIQLEFRDLSRQTGNPAFEHAAMNVSKILHNQYKPNGLVPIYISPKDGMLRKSSVVTLGARGDSYYEYLLKQWIQTGKTIDFLKDDYLEAVEGMRSKMLKRTALSNLTFLGELENNGQTFRPKMDHLVCYLPGTLALGYSHGLPQWHLDLAKSLIHTCYLTYARQPTGLAPEITYFKDDKTEDFYVKPNDAHNLLRPETVESLWYMHQITGDKIYQDWGWEIFGSFMKYTRTPYGFTSINSVLDPNDTRPRDMMESFFLAETLKYFYLLFSDKAIFDLNTVVFNTEAHPLPVYDN